MGGSVRGVKFTGCCCSVYSLSQRLSPETRGQGRDRKGTGEDVKLHLTSGGKAARTELTLVAPATELVFRTGRVAPATAAAARNDSPCFSPDSDAAAEEAGD